VSRGTEPSADTTNSPSVMDGVVNQQALKAGTCSSPTIACSQQNERYATADSVRVKADAIEPFTLDESTFAAVVTANAAETAQTYCFWKT